MTPESDKIGPFSHSDSQQESLENPSLATNKQVNQTLEWKRQREIALDLIEKMKNPASQKEEEILNKGISNVVARIDCEYRKLKPYKYVKPNINLELARQVLIRVFEAYLPEDPPENIQLRSDNIFTQYTRTRTDKILPRPLALLIRFYGLDGVSRHPSQLTDERGVTQTAIYLNANRTILQLSRNAQIQALLLKDG